ncbi:MAG: energy-coupling factor transporter ATPase [Ruminococcaceae bacterium]|nr:energy-coupling factor transporter ATPase [Oscillospiraceae bacterium]
MAKLSLENITYTYGRGTPFEKTALHNVNLTFGEGRITGLIGHTGSGKSTLVQLLNGIHKPESGRILLDGADIWEKPKEISKVRFRIGLVFQYPEYQLFEETVRKDIAFGPTNMKLPKEEIDRRVKEAAAFCGIEEEMLDASPFDLSGGQKRRVAIAGVIAMEPEVLILDEPAAGLDPMGREEILGRIWSYQRQKKSTVIIVSHSMEDMAVYCDDLVVMNCGQVHRCGSCEEVFSDARALEKVGLSIPQITKFMIALREKGLDVNPKIFTVEQAREELKRYYNSCSRRNNP